MGWHWACARGGGVGVACLAVSGCGRVVGVAVGGGEWGVGEVGPCDVLGGVVVGRGGGGWLVDGLVVGRGGGGGGGVGGWREGGCAGYGLRWGVIWGGGRG